MTESTSPRWLLDLSVEDFLTTVASDRPVPGGGSVAALSGALGASLVAMVARLTLGREKYAAHQDEMRVVLSRALELQRRLADLVDEDTAAYESVMAAYKLARDSDEDKAQRNAAIQRALRRAAAVPLEVAVACAEVLALAVPVAARGNRNAASDAAVGAVVAHAGLMGAARNVHINLQSITDLPFRQDAAARAADLIRVGEQVLAEAQAAADARG